MVIERHIPTGWVLHQADSSIPGRVRVTLQRDGEGTAWWLSLSTQQQERIPLYASGVGSTMEAAIIEASNEARSSDIALAASA